MSLVEKEITMQNVERARNNPELAKYKETEHKFVSTNPGVLAELFKAQSIPIEQIYLSTPDDEFSLRVRCVYGEAGPTFTATQKDRGKLNGDALERLEVDTPISAEAFAYYQAMNLPRVQKLRTYVTEGVTVDFYDNKETPVVVEVEHNDPDVRAELIAMMQELTGNTLVDQSADTALTNEALAYRSASNEQLRSPESLDTFTKRVLGEMIAQYVTGKNQVVVGLTGMSGSGKTTVTNSLQASIVELFGEQYRPIVLSTDDYHFGKKNLEERYGAPYTAWDHPNTYNTAELAQDLQALAEGESLAQRHFDFASEETIYDGIVEPSPFVIIEGLYAGSTDLNEVRDLHFALPTGLATSIGRDLRRLVIDNRANRAFPTPESRLRYQIETAAPLYLEQAQPPRASFSASCRPMAERAFMLNRCAEA
jgi:uridine kinase